MGRGWNLQSPGKCFVLYILSKISLTDKMYPSGMKAWHFQSRLNKGPPLGRWSWEEIREMWPQALTSPVSILPLFSPPHIISLPKKLSVAIHPGLLHCRWILYQLSHQGSPRILEWVDFPFSRGSSLPGIEPRSPTFQANSLPAEPPGKPKNTGVGSLSFSSGSSRPRDLTWVSCIAGGFFTSWATREAQEYWSG